MWKRQVGYHVKRLDSFANHNSTFEMHQTITTIHLQPRIAAIAPPHRDNGIQNHPIYLQVRLPTCADTFTIAMPVVYSQPASCERRPPCRESPFCLELLNSNAAATDSFNSSIETLPKTMLVFPSSSRSRTTSSLMRSSNAILRNTKRQP